MKPNTTSREAASVSRRSFFRLTMGSITLLPTVASALALAPQAALADDGGVVDDSTVRAHLATGTTIYIVKPTEIGLVVRDVSQDDDSANLICGAHVTITSRFNGKTVEGFTDDHGSIHFDISELAEDEGKKALVPHYDFNATIEVSAEGYRLFRASLFRIEGGTALAIPTQPSQPGVPYPMCTSFDEWDVLYSAEDASTFVSCTGNDAQHTIGVSLRDCPANATITAGIFCDGQRLFKTSAKSAADGSAEIAFSDSFLRSDSAAALPVGEDHEYALRYIADGTTYEVPIKLSVCAAPPEAQSSQIKKDMELVPFNDSSMFIGFTIPKNVPIVGETKIKLWEPSFPVWGSFDPFGFARLRFTTPEFGYVNDRGKPDKSGWQVCSRKGVKQQYADAWNKMKDATAETFASRFEDVAKPGEEDKGPNFFKQNTFARKFTFTAQLEAEAMATWSFEGKESRGRAQASIRVGCNYSFTETFWAGPFPILIRLGVGLNASAFGDIGFVGPSIWRPWDWRWDYSSSGFGFQLCFPPTLSIGAGIAGVASLSVKGSFSLTFSMHAGPQPEKYKHLPDTHLRLTGHAGITAEAEALFFSFTFKLGEWDDQHLIDNWGKDGKVDAAGAFAATSQSLGMAQAFEQGSIITEDALAGMAEFETSGLQAMNVRETPLDGYTLFEVRGDERTKVGELFLAPDEAMLLTGQAVSTNADAQDGASDVAPVALASALAAGEADATQGDNIEVVNAATQDAQPLAAAADQQPVAQDGGASEPIMLQDDGEVRYELRQSNALLSRFTSDAADARPIGEHSYVEIGDEAPNVLRLGLEQGFRPTTDIRLADGILSSSRFKLVTVGNADYIVRLGAVRVAGKVRTRVIAESVGGKNRRVLDFATRFDRDECFDYDFDIATTVVNGREKVNMVVISGTRDQGDGTSFAQAATKTYFSFLTCDDWGMGAFHGGTVSADAVDSIGDLKTYPYRNYSCPRLVQIKDEKDGKEYGSAVVTFLERASRFEEDIMGSDWDLTRTGVGLVFINDEDESVNVSNMDLLRACMGSEVRDPTITEIQLSGRADGCQLLELKGGQGAHYLLLETDPCWYVTSRGTAYPRLTDVSVIDLGDYDGRVSRLIPMEGGSYFLACVDGMLKRVDVQKGGAGMAPTLVYSDFGGAELNMNDFGVVEGGDILYWSATREDAGYAFDDASPDDPVMRDGEDGELNLIMGARVRDGELSRAFALCEVGHKIDRIRHFGNNEDHMSFISSTTVDLEAGRGEQWFTAVPWVRCANLLDAAPYDTLVAAGSNLPFFVTLRNDGNCYLAGVELTVAEVGGAAIGTMRLDFTEETIRASEWNPKGEDGTLADVESDWALAPGTTSRYLASGVTIPEDWQGEKEIEVFVTAVYSKRLRTSGFEAAASGAEDHSIEYLPEQRAKAKLTMGSHELDMDRSDALGAADVSVVRGSGGNGNSGDKQGSGKGGTKSGTKGSGGKGSSSKGTSAKSMGSKAGASTNATTAATGTPSSTPSTGDAIDAYKRGSMPTTGDPSNLSTAAVVALGGVASIAAAEAIHRKGASEE